jgi:hypothetical protein
MKKLITFGAMAFLFMAMTSQQAYAEEKTSASSAALITLASTPIEVDKRTQILKIYLEKYNSPLAPFAQTFIDQADKYNLDWKLVAAIAGVESYFGQMIPPNSYNGWGFGIYDDNILRFASWDDGIATVTQSLRERYMNERGANNIYEIGATYAADRQWAGKVQQFMYEIEQLESSSNNKTLSISI